MAKDADLNEAQRLVRDGASDEQIEAATDLSLLEILTLRVIAATSRQAFPAEGYVAGPM